MDKLHRIQHQVVKVNDLDPIAALSIIIQAQTKILQARTIKKPPLPTQLPLCRGAFATHHYRNQKLNVLTVEHGIPTDGELPEDHGLVPVDQHPVFTVPFDGTG